MKNLEYTWNTDTERKDFADYDVLTKEIENADIQ